MKFLEIQPCHCGKSPQLLYCGAYQIKCRCGNNTKWLHVAGTNYVEKRNSLIRFWNTMCFLGVKSNHELACKIKV